MKKILIIYASAGDGHKAAAEAIYNAFLDFEKEGLEVVIIDSLNYTSRFFKSVYKVGYMILITYLPNIWGFFYNLLDTNFFFMINKPIRRLTNALNTKRLVRFLVKEKFDVVIATHFMAVEVISNLKNRGDISAKLVTVITDFKPHLFWQAKDVNRYIVATDTTKDMLIKREVPPEDISALGIPVRKRFNAFLTKAEARRILKFFADKFCILVMGGGFGVGPIEEVVFGLQELAFDIQVVVVCGHNKRLFERLNILRDYFKKPVFVLGFCRNMDEIMAASDIMVSKSGGLTVAETLVKTLPLVTINPVPGQEMRNASFLFDNEVGFNAIGVADVNAIIEDFICNPERLAMVRSKMNNLAKPHATEDIIKETLSLVR